MKHLIQLSNGDWINPKDVSAIRQLPISFCTVNKEIHEPRFVVDLVGGMNIVVRCADADEVNKQSGELADAINTALK